MTFEHITENTRTELPDTAKGQGFVVARYSRGRWQRVQRYASFIPNADGSAYIVRAHTMDFDARPWDRIPSDDRRAIVGTVEEALEKAREFVGDRPAWTAVGTKEGN